jgi:hypothetical protein
MHKPARVSLLETTIRITDHHVSRSNHASLENDSGAPHDEAPVYPFTTALEPRRNRSLQPRDRNALVGVLYGLIVIALLAVAVIGVLALIERF